MERRSSGPEKVTREVYRHQVFRLVHASGCGWADPLERDAKRVGEDVRDEKVSARAAREVSVVVLDAARCTVDRQATDALRSELRARRQSVEAEAELRGDR